MPPVFRLERCGNRAVCREAEGRVLERFDHLAGAKPRQFPALAGRRDVLAVLHRHLVPIRALLEHAVDFFDAAAGLRHGSGVLVLRRADHDVGGLHLPAGVAASRHFEDVVAVPGADDGAEFADGRGVGGAFKRVNHLECGEPAEVAAVFHGAGVVGAALRPGDRHEVRAVGDAVAQDLDAAVRVRGVRWAGVFVARDEDVPRAHFSLFPVERFLDQTIQHLRVRQIRTGQLLPVPVQLALERGGRVHAARFRLEDLELEVDEQFHVFVEALLGDGRVAVVLEEDVLEVGSGDGFVAYGEYGLALSPADCTPHPRAQCQGSSSKSHVLHRNSNR